MGNLKFKDFRTARIGLLFAYSWAVALSGADACAAESSAVPAVSAQSAPSTSVQNIQRLLTLLAERYPSKYGAVNPGQVDGSLGASTRHAISKFQEISGTKPGTQTNEQLVANILSALTLISAQQPEEGASPAKAQQPAQEVASATPPKAETPKAEPFPAASPKPESPRTATRTAETILAKPSAPQQPAEKPASTAPSAAPASEMPAPTASTNRYMAPPPPAGRATAQVTQAEQPSPKPAPAPRANDRVYFVQAASLRSLAAAKNEWKRIFSTNRIALTGEQAFFEEADIAGRGVFYRILIGPMNERSAAQTLCNYLKQNQQPCVVTERNADDLKKSNLQKVAQTPAAPPATSNPDETAPAKTAGQAQQEARNTPDPAPTASPTPAVERQDPPVKAEQAPTQPTKPVAATPAGTSMERTPAPVPAAQEPDPAATPMKPAANAPAIAEASPPPVPAEDRKAETTGSATLPSSPASTPAAPNSGGVAAASSGTGGMTGPSGTDGAAQPGPQAAEIEPSQPAPIESAVAADGDAPGTRTATALEGAFAKLMKVAPGGTQSLGIAVVFVLGATLLLFIWRRRNRYAAVSQFVRPADFSFARPVPATSSPPDVMTDLESDFESATLRQSRDDRDAFLRDILGEDVDLNGLAPKEDYAIRINSSLKQLLASDPGLYKSIFLNLIFLSKVGAALNRNDITIEGVNGHFQREFKLLHNYFKIHILELDDRHRIRKELPGLFYCLQLSQQRQRTEQHHTKSKS